MYRYFPCFWLSVLTAIDCLARLISEMTCYVFSGTLCSYDWF